MDCTVRGKKPLDDPQEIKRTLIENKDRLLVDGKLRAPKDSVWEELKTEYKINKSAKALYTFVCCNKWNIKYDLGLQAKHSFVVPSNTHPNTVQTPIQTPILESSESESDNLSDDSYQDEITNNIYINATQPTKDFNIFIPKDKWKAMEPEERRYFRKNSQEQHRISSKRKYKVLKPGVWTDIFNSLVWDSIKYPCSWSFKRNYMSIKDDAKLWLLARATCACGNKLCISYPNPPPADPLQNGLQLDVKVWGNIDTHLTFNEKKIKKRPYAGTKRKALGELLIDRNLKASRIRNEMASEMMDYGDNYPAHLPTNAVGRQIRAEAQKARRMDKDPIKSIQLLKYSTNPLYMFSIQDIGFDPFFVHMLTPDQLKIYNTYCDSTYSRLIIDATGGVVNKLDRPGNTKSRHIFLYIGVIRIPGSGEGLIPVLQMLSERQNANAIYYWLSEWVRNGAKIPNEVVLDDSAALISAVCRMFGGEASTMSYLTKCFKYMRGDETAKPKCLIRIDVAHLTNLIRKWPEVSKLKKRTKEFFIRTTILLAQSTTLEDVESMLVSILTVALSETEGVSTSTGEPTPCEMQKKILIAKIAGVDYSQHDSSSDHDHENVSDIEVGSVTELAYQDKNLKIWFEKIKSDTLTSIIDDGDRDNIMHHPEFAKKLEHLIYILPLWSKILPTLLKSPYPRAVGAFVESEFSKIKQTLLRKNLRVDDFIKEYLEVCDGTIKIAGTVKPLPTSLCNTLDQPSNQTQATETLYVDKGQVKSTEMDLGERTNACPVCTSGNMPGGGHICIMCNNAVHALDSCSQPIEGEEEGYGQKRICNSCFAHIGVSSKDDNPSTVTGKENIVETSIVKRPDMTISKNQNVEASSVEGWRGLSLPRKKMSGFYWKPNPDFPTLLLNTKKTKIGVLKNGIDPALKPLKIKNNIVILSNTCTFDSPCQVFATAYCDSQQYRSAIDTLNVEGTILDVAKYLALHGNTATSYRKRGNILFDHIPHQFMKGGSVKVDCATDCSSLLRRILKIPSLTENYSCSSPHCPQPSTERRVPLVSVVLEKHERYSLSDLQLNLETADVEDLSDCHLPLKDTSCGPDYVINDCQLSTKGPLCSGVRKRQTSAGPHLVVEVVGSAEMQHSGGEQIGVRDVVSCYLHDIPKSIKYKEKQYTLRGTVTFNPPASHLGIGHFRGYAIRPDLSWEIYDDLREKAINIDSSASVNVHVLIYTV